MSDIQQIIVTAPRDINPRRMKVTFGDFNDENGDVFREYNQDFTLHVTVKKDMLAISNVATIEIMNMNDQDRAALVGEFTARRARKNLTPFIPVEIRIGRASDTGSELPNRIFVGCICTTNMTNPPNINVQIQCATNQNDRAQLSAVNYPKTGTFENLVNWSAGQLGLTPIYDVDGGPRTVRVQPKIYNVAALPVMLQAMYRKDIAVYIDDDKLIVKSIFKALNGPVIDVNVNTGLIGVPAMTEWGVRFMTLADVAVKIGGAVKLTSIMNPALNGTYVVTSVEYTLESRGNSWYANWHASPPALQPT